MSGEIFALADCNSFYCSCERVFDPSLKNKPVGVLSNNDGCFVSRTDELKALGVPMGAPYFKYKEVIAKNNVAVFSSNYVLYGDMSSRVMRTLEEFCPETQVYSIDEAFMNLESFANRNLEKFAREVRSTVMQFTGIPISIGIAQTKVLAKLANRWAKKNKESAGVLDLTQANLREEVLKRTNVGDLWGIGKQSVIKLSPYGIKTAWDLKCADPNLVQKLLTIQGRRIQTELNNISCIELNDIDGARKEILSSRSFGKPVLRIEDLKEAIANHISTASEKLRRQNSICKTLVVFIQTNPHKNIPQYYNSGFVNLLSGTSFNPKLITHAFQVLERIFKHGFEYKKCGVVLTNLIDSNQSQLNFFSSHDSEVDMKKMEVMDSINNKHGRGTIKAASCGTYNDWKMLSEMRSPCYTTRWNDVLEI